MLLRGKRVYMVEDNAENITVMQRILRMHGAIVFIDWFAGTEGAKVILKDLPIDLVILDLMLSGVRARSGFDIFDQIRLLPELKTIPIVAVSAADPSIALVKARDKGFAGFICKPVDYDRFPQQINDLIGGKQIWETGHDSYS
jgi:CheY-like chemotaxis protein